jgi:hypothetical protein
MIWAFSIFRWTAPVSLLVVAIWPSRAEPFALDYLDHLLHKIYMHRRSLDKRSGTISKKAAALGRVLSSDLKDYRVAAAAFSAATFYTFHLVLLEF